MIIMTRTQRYPPRILFLLDKANNELGLKKIGQLITGWELLFLPGYCWTNTSGDGHRYLYEPIGRSE